MATATLTDARISALKPRNSARDIRDGKLKGFGIRVTPSGGSGSSFIVSTKAGASGRSSATPN